MEIDPNEVLKQFMKLCNTDHAVLQHHLASNSVLEWFGRTVRGRANVFPYYRFDLSQQYEHDFEKAVKCEAFEVKPSHMQTKLLPETENISHEPNNKTEFHITLSTPLQRIVTPILPKVDRGKKFIASPETPPESSELLPKDNITPPQNINRQNDDAPPAKRLKFEETSGCAGDAHSSSSSKECQIEGKLCETSCDTRKEETFELGQGDCLVSKQDSTIDKLTSDTGYTDLKYLESLGYLRSRNNTKHRGVTESKLTSDISSKTPTNDFNPTNDLIHSSHTRKTKLKLSYRIRKHDKQLQFALIIYEHYARNPATRRNLLCEFHKAKDIDIDTMPSTKLIVSTSSTKTPKKSLKRSLRLF